MKVISFWFSRLATILTCTAAPTTMALSRLHSKWKDDEFLLISHEGVIPCWHVA
jgi:hypothetical protein